MDRELDDLLRGALADDLPEDAEAGMRSRIARFHAEKADGAAAAPWAWLVRRGVWASLSILMLAAGILLQGARAPSPFAERIAAVKVQFSHSETERR